MKFAKKVSFAALLIAAYIGGSNLAFAANIPAPPEVLNAIDFSNSEEVVLIPSVRVESNGKVFLDSTGAPIEGEFHIKLTRKSEQFECSPGSFQIRSYSFNGGQKWQDCKSDSDPVFQSKNFSKKLNKASTLIVSNQYIQRNTRKPHESALFAQFATTNNRPKMSRLYVNYLFTDCRVSDLSDPSNPWYGEWALTKSPTLNSPPDRDVLIAVPRSSSEKPDSLTCTFGNFPASGGIPVEPLLSSGKPFTREFYVRTGPVKEANGSYTPASVAKKYKVYSQSKAPRFRASRKGLVKLAVDKTLCYSLDRNGAGNLQKITNNNNVLNVADYETVWLWNSETAKKPATALQTLQGSNYVLPIRAKIMPVMLKGRENGPFEPQTLEINLQGEDFEASVGVGSDVSSWFNLPQGLTAVVSQGPTSTGSNSTLEIEFTGTPSEPSVLIINCIIPLNNGSIIEVRNANARFAVASETTIFVRDKAGGNPTYVVGEVGVTMTPTPVTLELFDLRKIGTGDTFVANNDTGKIDVSDWFTNIPAGLSAKIQGPIKAGVSSVVVEFSGMPTRAGFPSEAIIASIPGSALGSGVSLNNIGVSPTSYYNVDREASPTEYYYSASVSEQTLTISLAPGDSFLESGLIYVSGWFQGAPLIDSGGNIITATRVAPVSPQTMIIEFSTAPVSGSNFTLNIPSTMFQSNRNLTMTVNIP